MWNWKALKSSLCPQVTSGLSTLKIYRDWIDQRKRNILIAIKMLWKCVGEKMWLSLPDTKITYPFRSYKFFGITERNRLPNVNHWFFIFFSHFFNWLVWIKTVFVEQYSSCYLNNLCFSLRNGGQQTFCKGPESKYFRLCGPYMVSVAYSSLCYLQSFKPVKTILTSWVHTKTDHG